MDVSIYLKLFFTFQPVTAIFMVLMDRHVTRRQDSVHVDKHFKDYDVTVVNPTTITTLSVKVGIIDVWLGQQRNLSASVLKLILSHFHYRVFMQSGWC